MCYTGCRYELTWGDGAGECSLPNGEKPPMDAMCSINDLGAENAKLRELVKDMHECFRIGARSGEGISRQWCRELHDTYRDRMQELGIEVHHAD